MVWLPALFLLFFGVSFDYGYQMKETVISPGIPSEIITGEDHVAYLITEPPRELWKTQNIAEWEEQSALIPNYHQIKAPFNKTGISSVVPTIDRNKMWFLGYSNVWVSDNTRIRGNYLRRSPPVTLSALITHPNFPDYAIGGGYSKECNLDDLLSTSVCHYDIYLTKDFGETWKLVLPYVTRFQWSPRNEYLGIDRVFVSVYRNQTGNQFQKPVTDQDLLLSDDYFLTSRVLLEDVMNFVAFAEFVDVLTWTIPTSLREPQVSEIETLGSFFFGDPEPSNRTRKESHAASKCFESFVFSSSPSETKFLIDTGHLDVPLSSLPHTERLRRMQKQRPTAVLYPNCGHETPPTRTPRQQQFVATLYVSSDNGKSFTQADIPPQPNARGYVIEVDPITLTQTVTAARNPSHCTLYHSDVSGTSFTKSLGIACLNYFPVTESLKQLTPTSLGYQIVGDSLETFITHNSLGNWQPLFAPLQTLGGHSTYCTFETNCSLHLDIRGLHGGSFVTDYSAPGLIISTGNMGQSFEASMDEQQTFLSLDAGWTWEHLWVDAMATALGNNGALIVFAPLKVLGQHIYYTFDFGLSVHKVYLDEMVYVHQILPFSERNTEKFYIFATTNRNYESVIVFNIDIHSNVPRCMGLDSIGTANSDYAFSTVSSTKEQNGCFLGRKSSVILRKRHHECFDTRTDKVEVEFEGSCRCTSEDYECAPGYTRSFNAPYMDNDCYLIGGGAREQHENQRILGGDYCT